MSRDQIEATHAKEWQRCIINAGADENVAQQAVTLAALNGLFDLHRMSAAAPLQAEGQSKDMTDALYGWDAAQREVDRLTAQAVEDQRLSLEWMKKHDHLLGFIQKRPLLLKELIQEDAARAGDGETSDQEKT